jgi:hypothetical protein
MPVEDQLSVIDRLEADLDAKLKSAQALRQAILRRAFAGKLVPQDPNDEPAAELLRRIAAERAVSAKSARPKTSPQRCSKATAGQRSTSAVQAQYERLTVCIVHTTIHTLAWAPS